MHQGRPHFDPTMALPEDGWMSFQGIPHEYPTEGAPLELTLAYGGEEESQFGPFREGYAFPANGAGNPDTIVPQSLRRLTEPQNAAEMAGLVGTSFIEPFGSTIDVIDFLAGVEDGDWARSSWAAAGLLLPFVAGSTMRKVGGAAFDKVQGFSPEYLRSSYPTPAPGVPTTGTGGKTFLARGTDEQNELFHARRNEIQADIDAGNYEPHFDESQRYYADKSLIDEGPTRVPDPARDATKQKWLETYGTPETRARLNAAYDAAKESADAIDWYAVGQLQDEAIRILGPEAGAEWFARKFADQMAATTQLADPKSNLIKASYGNWLRRQGATDIPVDEFGGVSLVPKPVEGMLAAPLRQGFEIAEARRIDPSTYDKGFSFSRNFQGDLDLATIDTRMMELFDPPGGGGVGGAPRPKTSPPKTGYSAGNQVIAEEAAKRGVNPANFQDVAWAGQGGTPGFPMMRVVNEALERTARLTGQTTDQVLEAWIKNDAPLFAMGGLLGAGMVRSQNSNRPANYVEQRY